MEPATNALDGAAAHTPANPQAQSQLSRIPLEVLTRITYFISTEDLGNVRLTCRAIERALIRFFSHEFFTKRQFMVFSESLKALVDISKHPVFSQRLKHVIIGTDHFPSLRETHYSHHGSEHQQERLKNAVADQEFLLQTGTLRDMLTEAFAGLPSLEVVELRDFNSRTRRRDGLNYEWKSWGSTTLERETGSGLTMRWAGRNYAHPTAMFSSLVVASASLASKPQVPSLEVNLRDAGTGLCDAAFYYPPLAHVKPKIEQYLGRLTKLHLVILPHAGIDCQPEHGFLRNFLSKATNLTWLRINFQRGAESAKLLTSPESPHQPFAGKRALLLDVLPPKLEKLELGYLNIHHSQLTYFLTMIANKITSLSLRRVQIMDSPIPGGGDTGPAIDRWRVLFRKLKTLPDVTISEYCFSHLLSRSGMHWDVRTTFGDAKTVGAPPAFNMNRPSDLYSYKGDPEKILDQLINDMKTHFPQPKEYVYTDSSDDDDDEEEEEEEEGEGEEGEEEISVMDEDMEDDEDMGDA